MADEKKAAKYAEKQAKKQAIKDEKESKKVRQKFIGDNALITPAKRITPAIGLNSAMMVEFYERKMAKGEAAIALRKKLESEGTHLEAANVGINNNSDWQAGFEACCASLEEFRKLTRPYAPKFKNGWEYWVSACMYMEWCDNNPEIKSALAGKTAEWVETEVKRPYMKPAFAQFCGVSERLIRNSNLPHTVGGNTTAVNGNVDYGLLVANDFINMSFKDRKSTRLNSSHIPLSRMPSSA